MSLILEYDITQILDDDDYQKISENIKKYLEEEKKFLEDNHIKVLNIDIENHQIEIEKNSKINEILYKKIPFNIYDFEKIEEEKSKNIEDIKNKNKLKIDIILKYFKRHNIHYSKIKDNFIEFACPICKKHLKNKYKYICFYNSFHSISLSKTDCNNDNHIKYFKKMQNELKEIYNKTIDLNQENVKWNPQYTLTEIGTGKDKITYTLEKYWKIYKGIDDKPDYKLKVILCKQNIIKVLKHYHLEVKFNIISKKYDIFQFNTRSYFPLNYWVNEIVNYFDIRCIRSDKQKIEGVMTNIGIENQYNPVKTHLDKIYQDFNINVGDSEFKKLCECIKTTSENKEQKLFRFLLQTCYLMCRHEFQDVLLHGEFMLLLLGLQGTGKTSLVKKLSPDVNYFLEANTVDITNKDNQLRFASHVLVEVGELGSTYRKSDRDAFKAYITSATDKIRPPYGKEDITFRRRFSMVGTTNDNTILNDPTGSRRYLILADTEIDLKKLEKINSDKIWCYIYDRYKKGDIFYYSFEELQKIQEENKSVTFKSDRLTILESYFDLSPANDDSFTGYKLKDCWDHFDKYSFKDEKEEIKSKMILKKEFTKANVKSKFDTRFKIDKFYVKFKVDELIIEHDEKKENPL